MPLPDKPTNFMHSCFAAVPGTYVIEAKDAATGGFTREPVIAWAPDADNPYKAPYAITIHGLRRLVDSAILHPCGMVSDNSSVTAFSSAEEWLKFATTPKAKAQPDPKHQKPADTSPGEEPEEEPETDAPGNELGLDIVWTNKSFKTNSFWRYEDDDYDFVFAIDGGEDVPKATEVVTKIKRDEFMSLKKELDVMELADLKGGGEAPAEEPEDDADDLI